jgi:peptidyl-prolyl cis-trans isomerase B (cyclophilin B)
MSEAAPTGAIIETTHGNIEIEFFNDLAPGHVKNFVDLAQKGFYDGTTFHRVIPGFMIQGGDPNTKDKSASRDRHGTGGPGYTIKAEFNATSHKRGILSMARAESPDSAGCQFFICVADSTFLDRQHRFGVFGRHTHQARHPHPEHGTRPPKCDGRGHADNVADPDRGRQGRHQRRKMANVSIPAWLVLHD